MTRYLNILAGLALALTGLLLVDMIPTARAQGSLLVDNDFEANKNGAALRKRERPQGWYESRRQSKAARKLLMLSTKKIGKNATKKAMIKASPEFNTYLSQVLADPQDERMALQWDIYVREILPPYNRSAFQMIGNASVKGRGPNGSGPERFVFLGFENAETPGLINLFAFEGRDPDHWDNRTLLVPDLKLKKWHTVRVELDIPGESYLVSVPGVTPEPIAVHAFQSKNKPVPKVLTHVSFASWNDGPGTFYVDNVHRP